MTVLDVPPPRSETHCRWCDEPLAFCGCNLEKEDEFGTLPVTSSIPASVQSFLDEETKAPLEDSFAFTEPAKKVRKTKAKEDGPAKTREDASAKPKEDVLAADKPEEQPEAPKALKTPYRSNDRQESGVWVLDGFPRPALYKNDYVSVSRLKTYEECPRQFFFHYVTHASALPPTPNAPNVLGSVLHEALELIYKWVDSEEYIGIIREDIQKRFLDEAWKNFEDQKRGVLTGMESYIYCQRSLAAYFRGRDVNHFHVVGIEREFMLEIGGVKVKGYIDRIERHGDTATIIDYKNGFMLFSQDELRNDLQATIYDIVVRMIYPWVRDTVVEFHMLRHQGTVQTTTRGIEHREAAHRYLPLLTTMSEEDPTYQPRISKYCGYCDYRTLCSLYQRMMAEHDERSTIDETSVEEVAKQYHRTTNIAKSASDRKRRLGDLLLQFLKTVPEEAVEADGYVFRVREDMMGNLPVGRTMRLLKEAGVSDSVIERALTITKDGVEFALASVESDGKRVMLKADVFAMEEKRSKAPFVQISKGKL